jgi:RimJ/RimL family protein N-acetyltransferase
MNALVELQTDRLRLRNWLPGDREPFAALNADPRVIEYLPALSRQQSDDLIARFAGHFDRHGFGSWAVEIRGLGVFAGFIGLNVPRFEAHFTPCVEIGWRLGAEHWGQGYATEGARAALDYGFGTVGLDEIVAYTVPANVRSRRVMEKLGMTCNPADDFDHPGRPEERRLRRHDLYRISRTPGN